MKMRFIRFVLLLLAASAIQAPMVLAQSSTPACEGNIATVRVSAIKPNAIDLFLKAVAAHKAWYLNHGSKDVIVAARVLVRDPQSGASKYSDVEAMTYQVYPEGPRQQEATHDAAYSDFVKMYNDSSEIKSEYRVCLPKLVP